MSHIFLLWMYLHGVPDLLSVHQSGHVCGRVCGPSRCY
jgi:hypothetical protein